MLYWLHFTLWLRQKPKKKKNAKKKKKGSCATYTLWAMNNSEARTKRCSRSFMCGSRNSPTPPTSADIQRNNSGPLPYKWSGAKSGQGPANFLLNARNKLKKKKKRRERRRRKTNKQAANKQTHVGVTAAAFSFFFLFSFVFVILSEKKLDTWARVCVTRLHNFRSESSDESRWVGVGGGGGWVEGVRFRPGIPASPSEPFSSRLCGRVLPFVGYSRTSLYVHPPLASPGPAPHPSIPPTLHPPHPTHTSTPPSKTHTYDNRHPRPSEKKKKQFWEHHSPFYLQSG